MKDIDFTKSGGLIPAVVQDARTRTVLMVGFMNQEALEKTEREGVVTFFSSTKNRLWTKGETSGHTLRVQNILKDCDNDTVLIKAIPEGPTCHTGADTCFNEVNTVTGTFLGELEGIIRDRKQQAPEGSYTASLFAAGLHRMAQKVGEEGVEVALAAKDDDLKAFEGECADLVFHLLVLLNHKGSGLESICKILVERNRR